MKSITKKLAMLVTIIMLASIIFAGASHAASMFTDVAVSTVSGKAGETVTVEIKATKDMAVSENGGGLLLKYDNRKLKCVNTELDDIEVEIKGLEIAAGDRVDGKGYGIGMVSKLSTPVTIKEGTVIGKVKFQILKDTSDNQTLSLVDLDEYKADPNAKALATGKVTVASSKPTTEPTKAPTAEPTEVAEPTKKPDTTKVTPTKAPTVEPTKVAEPTKKPTTAAVTPTATPTKKASGKKDESPKTGVENFIAVAGLGIVIATACLVVVSKKDNK